MRGNKYYQLGHASLRCFHHDYYTGPEHDVSVLLCYTMTDIDDVREREIIDALLYLYLVSASRIWNKVQFIEITWYCDRR